MKLASVASVAVLVLGLVACGGGGSGAGGGVDPSAPITPGDQSPLVTANVTPTGGGGVSVSDTAHPLAGAGVEVPPGAVAEDTEIAIAPTAPPDEHDDWDMVGEPVACMPSGLGFAQPVQLVLPFDPRLLPVGTTADDLRVLKVESDGGATTLVPTSIDESAHTVTVSISSFSTYVVTVPAGMPDLTGRSYHGLRIRFELEVSPEQESRYRAVSLEIRQLKFEVRNPGLDGYASYYEEGLLRQQTFTCTLPTAQAAPEQVVSYEGRWDYAAGTTHVDIGDVDGTWRKAYAVSRGGQILYAIQTNPGQPEAYLEIYVERPERSGYDLLREIADCPEKDYHVGGMELHMPVVPGPYAPETSYLRLGMSRMIGTLRLWQMACINPPCSYLYDLWYEGTSHTYIPVEDEHADGVHFARTEQSIGAGRSGGNWAVGSTADELDRLLFLTPDGSDPRVLTFLPGGQKNRILLGTTLEPESGRLLVWIGIRQCHQWSYVNSTLQVTETEPLAHLRRGVHDLAGLAVRPHPQPPIAHHPVHAWVPVPDWELTQQTAQVDFRFDDSKLYYAVTSGHSDITVRADDSAIGGLHFGVDMDDGEFDYNSWRGGEINLFVPPAPGTGCTGRLEGYALLDGSFGFVLPALRPTCTPDPDLGLVGAGFRLLIRRPHTP